MTSTLGLFTYCAVMYAIACLGVAIGYHRMLVHRSFAAHKWLARTLVTFGLPAGTPVQWTGNHRWHHAIADRLGDTHSPVLDGFWFAHVGWYLESKRVSACVAYALAGPLRMLFDAWWRGRANSRYDHYAPDVAADPYYRFLSTRLGYWLAMNLFAIVMFGVATWVWGATGLAVTWAMSIYLYNGSDAINSVAHLFGEKTYPGPAQARNGWIMGFITLGEGWHANHHAFPHSAKTGLCPGQWDPTWQLIRLFARLGLARDLHVPSREEIEKAIGSSPQQRA